MISLFGGGQTRCHGALRRHAMLPLHSLYLCKLSSQTLQTCANVCQPLEGSFLAVSRKSASIQSPPKHSEGITSITLINRCSLCTAQTFAVRVLPIESCTHETRHKHDRQPLLASVQVSSAARVNGGASPVSSSSDGAKKSPSNWLRGVVMGSFCRVHESTDASLRARTKLVKINHIMAM